MMKFFRKYNKQLLAIFMALLLIVWLGGSALTELIRSRGDYGKTPQGTAYGKTITLKDMQPSFLETETLEQIMGRPLWQYPWAFVVQTLGMNMQQAGAIRQMPLSKDEWYMLDTAARKAHVQITPEALESFKAKSMITPEVSNVIRQRTHKTQEELDEALTSFARVQEAAVQAAQAVKVSEADINEMVRRTGEKARIEAVAIEAKSFYDKNYQPTPQEIQAQFDKYKNITSQPSSPGYELPAAAQIEYIEIDSDALAQRQKVDDQEAYAYWKEHSSEFTKPTSTRPTTSSAPASQPKPYTSFSEASPKVIAKLKKEKAQNEAQRIIAPEMIAKLAEPWAALTTTRPSDAKTAPDRQKAADLYPKLIEQFQAKYPGAFKYKRLDLIEEPALAKEPVGAATALPNSEQETTVAQAAFMVPGLDTRNESPQSQRFFRGLYETASEPFAGSSGNVYIIRTVAIRPKQAPSDLSTVRERIVEDLRNARAFEEAQKAAQKLFEAAKQKGLQAALDGDPALKARLGPDPLKKPEPFAQMMMRYFGAPLKSPELGDKIFALAGKTTTQPIKVTMVEDKAQKRFLIGQLEEIMPVTREEYQQMRTRALQYIETQHRMDVLREWFDPAQIRARVQWVDAPRPKPTPVEGEEKS
jgi:hypothetical protein